MKYYLYMFCLHYKAPFLKFLALILFSSNLDLWTHNLIEVNCVIQLLYYFENPLIFTHLKLRVQYNLY